jgi:hypothetical protein
VENAPGESGGVTLELDKASKTIRIDFGNPALGQLNAGDIIATFTVRPFFKNGFDEDRCCVTASGSFDGAATIDRFTDRGTPAQTRIAGRTAISESVAIGECDVADDAQPCCTTTFKLPYREGFNVNLLGFDVDTNVSGTITIVFQVYELPA